MVRTIIKTNLILVLLTSGCATFTNDIHVEARADPMIDLGNYKTFAWIEPDVVVYDPLGKWESPQLDVNEEIKWLISRELHELNMVEVKGEPDMYVTFSIRADMEDWQLQRQPMVHRYREEYSPEAKFSIILVDGVTGFIAWVGRGTAYVEKQPTMDILRKRLDFTVFKLFQLYPIVN